MSLQNKMFFIYCTSFNSAIVLPILRNVFSLMTLIDFETSNMIITKLGVSGTGSTGALRMVLDPNQGTWY